MKRILIFVVSIFGVIFSCVAQTGVPMIDTIIKVKSGVNIRNPHALAVSDS